MDIKSMNESITEPTNEVNEPTNEPTNELESSCNPKIVLSKLDVYTREWASKLTDDDVAHILYTVYKLPGMLDTDKRYKGLTSSTTTSTSSANLGLSGENKFADICLALPSNYTVKNTAKQGHKGDFIISYSRDGTVKTCLIDIKNYSSPVPKKEIDKFMEDITFGTYDCGLIISYNTKFVGIPNHIHFEDFMTPCGKIPIMYLTSNDKDIILQSIQLIISKVIVTDEKSLETSKVESIIEVINSSLVQSADTRRLLSEITSSVSKSVQKCQENLVTHEAHIKKSLKELSHCVTKTMINKILPHVPKLASREDNIDGETKISPKANIQPSKFEFEFADSSNSNDMNINIERICKNDRHSYETLVKLKWKEMLFLPDDKYICELVSNNMELKVAAMKTKTSVVLGFLESVEIIDDEFNTFQYKQTKNNDYICTLDDNFVEFVRKYMN